MESKNLAAMELGRRGGLARAKNLSRERISEIGKKAAAARWKGHKKKPSKNR
jgi:general stress protein YciG